MKISLMYCRGNNGRPYVSSLILSRANSPKALTDTFPYLRSAHIELTNSRRFDILKIEIHSQGGKYEKTYFCFIV